MERVPIFLIATLAIAASAIADDAPDCTVTLTIEALADEIALPQSGLIASDNFRTRVENHGATAVTLVQPGDGSSVGWRTPAMRWRVEGEVVKFRGKRCGSMNPLEAKEVFVLEPGESAELGPWVPDLPVEGPGAHRVRLEYENDPALVRESTRRRDDPVAIRRMRASTPCVVRSNALTVQVSRTARPARGWYREWRPNPARVYRLVEAGGQAYELTPAEEAWVAGHFKEPVVATHVFVRTAGRLYVNDVATDDAVYVNRENEHEVLVLTRTDDFVIRRDERRVLVTQLAGASPPETDEFLVVGYRVRGGLLGSPVAVGPDNPRFAPSEVVWH